MGLRSPDSRRLPSPTANTLPRRGFSLAVSGRTIPLLVLLSASTRLIRILSPSGRNLAISDAPSKKRIVGGQLSVVSCGLSVVSFGLLNFLPHLDLFRISPFGFRIFPSIIVSIPASDFRDGALTHEPVCPAVH